MIDFNKLDNVFPKSLNVEFKGVEQPHHVCLKVLGVYGSQFYDQDELVSQKESSVFVDSSKVIGLQVVQCTL